MTPRAALGRISVSALAFRRLSLAALVLLSLIVVTGGAVRLTGSGLGCPTWPQCGAGSFVNRPEYALHGVIEFGNRTVSGLVGLLVLVLPWLAMHRVSPGARPRRDLVGLGFGLWVGYLGQVVLGGVTVLFHLHPALVASHFLLSMLLLLDAAALHSRAQRPDLDLPLPSHAGAAPLAAPLLRRLATLTAAVAAAVLTLGTVVTGTGPHSGDASHVRRFGFDIRGVSQLHADSAMLLTGLVLAGVLAVRLSPAPALARRLAGWLAGAVLAQAALGFTQYFLGVPVALVALHIAGATLLWVLAVSWRLSLSEPAGSEDLVERHGDEQDRQIGDRQVEQPHRPRVAAG